MATALTKAKRFYTTRKNTLTRFLDPIPQLLQDQAVRIERLLDHRKGSKAAWEQFVVAHDGLVEVLPEGQEDTDVEEFGALNNRWRDLMGDLADKIRYNSDQKLQQDKQAEEQRVQQERQAELERQHQLKLDQVIARRAVFALPTSTPRLRSN